MSVFLELAAEMGAALEAAENLAAGMEDTARRATSAAREIGRAQATSSAEKTDSARSEATTPGGRVATSTSAALGAVTNAVIQSEGRRT
jgi:hypothetical protein